MPDIIARHDAILPVEWQGVKWALVNLGDNTETENGSMAELLETINRHLLALSNTRDCFVVNPPSIECVKAHHNMYVRLNKFIDSRTKADNEPRLDFAHITPVRRKFATYPVRYYDQKNRWTRRWTELYLYGISNIAQLAEANTWTNDWNLVSAAEMKKPFREAYRLMAVELFDVDLEAAKDPDFRMEPAAFDNYNPSALIPTYEWQEHPFVDFFTEDVLAPGARRHIPTSDNINDAPNPGYTSGVGTPGSGAGGTGTSNPTNSGNAGGIIQ
mgnify:CR=1 FL=1